MPEPHPSLLPCPFCGGEAAFAHVGGFYAAYCPASTTACAVHPATQYQGTADEAARKWNTRALSRVLASVDGTVRLTLHEGRVVDADVYVAEHVTADMELSNHLIDMAWGDDGLKDGTPVRITITAEEEADHG